MFLASPYDGSPYAKNKFGECLGVLFKPPPPRMRFIKIRAALWPSSLQSLTFLFTVDGSPYTKKQVWGVFVRLAFNPPECVLSRSEQRFDPAACRASHSFSLSMGHPTQQKNKFGEVLGVLIETPAECALSRSEQCSLQSLTFLFTVDVSPYAKKTVWGVFGCLVLTPKNAFYQDHSSALTQQPAEPHIPFHCRWVTLCQKKVWGVFAQIAAFRRTFRDKSCGLETQVLAG